MAIFAPTPAVTGSNGVLDQDGQGAGFIPEIWSDEVIASYKSNLVLANLVMKFDHTGRKGDTIHVPKFARGRAEEKSQEDTVTLQAPATSQVTISIDQHWEYSVLIEDIASVQGLESYRAAYTDDGGYALAKLVDQKLFRAAMKLNGGDGGDDDGVAGTGGTTGDFGSTGSAGCVIGSDGSTFFDAGANNAAALTDAGIRTMIQALDDGDVPLTERFMVIPPVEKNSLMGIARFTEQAFVGETGGANTIRSGIIGDIYGIPVYVSTNCPLDDESTQEARMGIIGHRSCLVLAEQLGIRTQSQYMQQYLADLFTADTLFGVQEYRDESGIPFAVPA